MASVTKDSYLSSIEQIEQLNSIDAVCYTQDLVLSSLT